MTECNFYTPEEVRPLYGEIVPVYQAAFAGEPWNEASKCADQRRGACIGGLSAVAVGSLCGMCELRPTRQAYEADELTERFDSLAVSRPAVWYTERNVNGLTMAAVAWQESPQVIVREKYPEVPDMSEWIAGQFPGELPIMWLDEVFANKRAQSNGNLRNFGDCARGLARRLGRDTVAYRTIAPQMTRVAERDFGSRAVVLKRGEDVPDRRDFVIINTEEE